MRRYLLILILLFSAVLRAEEPGVAIVTGGTLGIGYDLVKLLYERNWKVATIARNGLRVQDLKNIFMDRSRFHAEAVSVSDYAAVRKFVDTVEKKFGPVTALVNNAGLTGQLMRVGEMPFSEVADIISTNLTGTINLTADVLARMSAHGVKGTIINVSSGSSKGVAGLAAYSAAKAGVNVFTIAAAKEYEPAGIRIFAFNPGHVDTRLQTGVREADPKVFPSAPVFREYYEKGELVTPLHSAQQILYMLNHPLSFQTGAFISYSDVAARMTIGGCNLHHFKYILMSGK